MECNMEFHAKKRENSYNGHDTNGSYSKANASKRSLLPRNDLA